MTAVATALEPWPGTVGARVSIVQGVAAIFPQSASSSVSSQIKLLNNANVLMAMPNASNELFSDTCLLAQVRVMTSRQPKQDVPGFPLVPCQTLAPRFAQPAWLTRHARAVGRGLLPTSYPWCGVSTAAGVGGGGSGMPRQLAADCMKALERQHAILPSSYSHRFVIHPCPSPQQQLSALHNQFFSREPPGRSAGPRPVSCQPLQLLNPGRSAASP